MTEFDDQLQQLAALARSRDVHTLVLRDPASLSWLFGARWNVPATLDTSCFDAIVTLPTDGARDGNDDVRLPSVQIVTDAIEAPRLADTELADVRPGGSSLEWTVVPWSTDRSTVLPVGAGVATDTDELAPDFATLRRQLNPLQADRLRRLAADTAAAVTAAATRVRPGQSEYQAAAVLSAELLDREIEPVCLLVAGGDRMGRHRHPLPTAQLLGDRASLVCCGRRHGLIASATRIICFGEPAGRDRYQALLEVESAFLDASVVGARLGDVVQTGVDAYAANGFDPQEWTRHHQGGLTGWQPREFTADPSTDLIIPANSVVAWNPSGDTWKVEDTCLVTDAGLELLITDPAWPAVEVDGRSRPDLLVL